MEKNKVMTGLDILQDIIRINKINMKVEHFVDKSTNQGFRFVTFYEGMEINQHYAMNFEAALFWLNAFVSGYNYGKK